MIGGLAGPDHCPTEATGPAAICSFFPYTVTNTSEPDSNLSYRGIPGPYGASSPVGEIDQHLWGKMGVALQSGVLVQGSHQLGSLELSSLITV